MRLSTGRAGMTKTEPYPGTVTTLDRGLAGRLCSLNTDPDIWATAELDQNNAAMIRVIVVKMCMAKVCAAQRIHASHGAGIMSGL